MRLLSEELEKFRVKWKSSTNILGGRGVNGEKSRKAIVILKKYQIMGNCLKWSCL